MSEKAPRMELSQRCMNYEKTRTLKFFKDKNQGRKVAKRFAIYCLTCFEKTSEVLYEREIPSYGDFAVVYELLKNQNFENY